MTSDHSIVSACEDEIDLREVFAALQRRWFWLIGGGFMGLVLAAGVASSGRSETPQFRASLVVDTSQSPCNIGQRIVSRLSDSGVFRSDCVGKFETTRFGLLQIAGERLGPFAKKYGKFTYEVRPLLFDKKVKVEDPTHLVLNVTFPASLASEVSRTLAVMKQNMTEVVLNDTDDIGVASSSGPGWIFVEEPSEIDARDTSFRSLSLGLFGGLVVGAGSGLIADRRSNRVYSRDELLRRLNYPLRLGLPAGPWNSPAVPVLVGQLATQLDQSLSWRVLSIARQHEAVAPLTQLLQQQGGPALQCRSADPLLAAVLHMESSDRPAGLLLVVQPGFNSARALEEARLLISQMTTVQAVGVVLIGAPLPEELSSSVAG